MNLKKYFLQFILLLWKNFLQKLRHPTATIFEIIIPIIGFLLILLLKISIGQREQVCFSSYSSENLHPSTTLDAVLDNSSTVVCNFTYFYTPDTTQTADIITDATKLLNTSFTRIKFIAASNEEELETLANDLIAEYNTLAYEDSPLTCNRQLQFVGIFRPYVAGVIFNQLETDIEVTIRLDPALEFNKLTPNYGPGSLLTNFYRDSGFVNLQDAITQSIILYKVANVSSNITQEYLPIDIREMPYPAYLDNIFLDNLFLLRLILLLAFIYSVSILTRNIVIEKESRLRESLLIMGLSKWVNWLSLYTVQLIIFTAVVLVITIIISVGKIFEYSNFWIIFLLLFFYVNSLISFSFLMSTFFNSATLSLFFTFGVHVLNFMPYFSLFTRIDEVPVYVRFIICLFSNSCVAIGELIIARREVEQVGAQWTNILTPKENYDEFALIYVYAMLILDTILYLLLTWYIDEVSPKEYGHRRPLYFPFTADYWCGKSLNCCKPDTTDKTDGRDVMVDAIEDVNTGDEIGIRIVGLSKQFGKKKVVNNLNLNVFSGKITSLLGHNGAGKSTTISMLTGLYPPSYGTAYINEHDITRDTEQIRKSLGICPQHNILVDGLTVKEQMHFFIRLKGVWGWKTAREEVLTMVKDVRLEDKANNLSHQLSGGMKRRLSIGLALIGGPETVILDEPTSGLDPQSRRMIWDLLEKYKENRTILLTTHFMDEADILSDRIAILAQGKLNAYGSPLFLKSRFGTGYHLIMLINSTCNPSRTFDIVKHYVPGAEIDDLLGFELSFILPETDTKLFVKLFEFLDESMNIVGVESYGCGLTTLEEVFRRVSDPNFMVHERKKSQRRNVLNSHFRGSSTMEEVEHVCKCCISIDSRSHTFVNQELDDSSLKLIEVNTEPQTGSQDIVAETQFIGDISSTESVPQKQKTIAKESISKNFSKTYPVYTNRPRLNSVVEYIYSKSTPKETYEKFIPKLHDDFDEIVYNKGLTLRFQQILAILVKRCIYTFRNYPLLLMQTLMPLSCTLMGLAILIINYVVFKNTIVLNVQNSLVTPSKASLLFVDLPQTFNTLPNEFDFDLMANFSLSNGFVTATSIFQDYLSIVNSIENYTNISQCCGYEYQILDQFCAHRLTQDFGAIDFCSEINAKFSYTHCIDCLDCQSTFTCPKQPLILADSFNPDTYSVPNQGPLDVKTTYVDEVILRLSKNNQLEFFENYLMVVSTNAEDPLDLVSECLCCSEFSTFFGENETNGTCSSAISADGFCDLPSVGLVYYDTFFYPSRVTLWYNNQVASLVATGLNILHEYQLFHLWHSYNLSGPVPSITITDSPLPSIGSETFNAVDKINGSISAVCFVLALSIIVSSFIVFFVEEKENLSKFLQDVSGLHPSSYWIGNCIIDLILAFIVLHLTFVSFTFFTDLPFFGDNLALVYILITTFILSTIPISYFASFIFISPLTGFVSLLVIHLLLFLLLFTITVVPTLVLDDEELSHTLQYIFSVVPSFSFGYGMFNVFINQKRLETCSRPPNTLELCRLRFTVLEDMYTFQIPGILTNVVASLSIGLIFLILTIILINWVHINNLLNKFYPNKVRMGNFDNEDQDVKEERERVESGENLEENAILLRNFSKTYSGNVLYRRKPKDAVKNLSIGIKYGECFGLLGVNGAGKTTTFEMLTGILLSTGGTAKIHGFDIRTQLHLVRNRVGYCPQFDALQGYLNSYQLLTLYARIRGLPEGVIDVIVRKEISRMDLDVYAKHQIHTYSGGNKRKLSTAAALIGNPPVLLLDEPTTSMDPTIRRHFWDVIHDITKGGRCIVLTTHSMEECEALCTRLAIMVDGEFKCLGSVQYLKNRFGEGFTLYLRIGDVEVEQVRRTRLIYNVKEFILNTFPGSMLLSEHGSTLDYHLLGGHLTYSEIFEILEQKKEDLHITDYGVNQTTLEQIFLTLAKKTTL